MVIMNFEQLTSEEKRVAIAKDVIASVLSKQYNVRQGIYFTMGELYKEETDTSVQKLLLSGKECKVCAVGACFTSLIKFENKLNVGDIQNLSFSLEEIEFNNDSISARKRLLKYFSVRTISLIECIFEQTDAYYLEDSIEENIYDIIEKYREDENDNFLDHDTVLINIMENIIANRGEFIP